MQGIMHYYVPTNIIGYAANLSLNEPKIAPVSV